MNLCETWNPQGQGWRVLVWMDVFLHGFVSLFEVLGQLVRWDYYHVHADALVLGCPLFFH